MVNGTTRLQPVVLQIGQIAGLIASESVKNNINTHQIDIRNIQKKFLDKGGYIQPYLDVEKNHPFFIKLYSTVDFYFINITFCIEAEPSGVLSFKK